jgi:hypothetical protein
MLMGVGVLVVAVVAYLRPHIRNLEDDLPDMVGELATSTA